MTCDCLHIHEGSQVVKKKISCSSSLGLDGQQNKIEGREVCVQIGIRLVISTGHVLLLIYLLLGHIIQMRLETTNVF